MDGKLARLLIAVHIILFSSKQTTNENWCLNCAISSLSGEVLSLEQFKVVRSTRVQQQQCSKHLSFHFILFFTYSMYAEDATRHYIYLN